MSKRFTVRKIKMTSVGGSDGFIVPAPIRRNEEMDRNKYYNIIVEEVEQEGMGGTCLSQAIMPMCAVSY